ncbi:MAG TPA: CmcJ/NvfI family oxidoreductase [Halioglobus sp.]
MKSHHVESINAALNFAVADGGVGEWSNLNPQRTRQNLRTVDVEIRNGRNHPVQPTLENEGLMIAQHPVSGADWTNNAWIESVYLPSCNELVKKLTGAKTCTSIFVPLQRRVDFDEHAGSIPAAQFVHLDNTHASARLWAEPLAQALGESLENAVIYNVWKSTTPPPQDFPLAIADLRSIPEENHAEGSVVEELGDRTIVSPYIALLHSELQTYYYFPDVAPDESLVFVGLHLDPSRKMGCAHSAFRHPAPGAVSVPRRSIESRVLAFFD